MRGGGVFQLVGLVDLDFDRPGGDDGEKGGGAGGKIGPSGGVGGEGGAGEEQAAFGRQRADVIRRDRAGGSAETDHQPERGEAVQAGAESVLADAVVHHRNHGAAG